MIVVVSEFSPLPDDIAFAGEVLLLRAAAGEVKALSSVLFFEVSEWLGDGDMANNAARSQGQSHNLICNRDIRLVCSFFVPLLRSPLGEIVPV